MNIIIYAIAKNEKKFAERFMASCADADGVYVLDTGSTDGTPDALRALGAEVSVAELIPWRFDRARNFALSLVPAEADVCVALDLDEVLCEGWREAIEAAWTDGVTRGRYEYVWSHTDAGGDGVVFLADKIHARYGYHWRYPVHETLCADWPETAARIPGLRIEHWPDAGKSRGSDLPLLELAVREEPGNDRHMHYLGREYFFHREYGRAIETLVRHIHMPTASWAAERAQSMLYIGRCFEALGDDWEAAQWYIRAVGEDTERREARFALARLKYRTQDWRACLDWAKRTLEVRERDLSYMTEPEAWGAEPYDLAAIACWHLRQLEDAENYAETALCHAPEDERLQNNLRLIREAMSDGDRAD